MIDVVDFLQLASKAGLYKIITAFSRSFLVPPKPTGVAATDFANLRDFFIAAPAGARIMFPYAATYQAYSGAIMLKAGQIVDMNGSLIQRPPEIVGTTTTTLGNGSTSVGMTSVTGFQPGMTINVKGQIVGDSSNVQLAYLGADNNHALRISSIDTTNSVLNFEGPVSGITSTTGGALGVIAAGATVCAKAGLVDACANVAGTKVTLLNVNLDGNRAQNQTNNRWESTCDLRAYTQDGLFDNINIINSPGEGIVSNGINQTYNNVTLRNLNGNGVHFNGWSRDTKVFQINVDTCNLDYTVGHGNGAVIASDDVYRTIIDDFHIRNARLTGIGSFDSSSNSFAKIANGYIRDCWGGGLGLFSSPNQKSQTALDVRNVEVQNCGISYVGTDITGGSYVERARRVDMRDVNFIDSLVYITGLTDSIIDVRVTHQDSATPTPSSIAAGRTSNYAGTINGTPFNAGASLNLGATVTALATIGGFTNCDVKIRVKDSSPVPVQANYSIRTVYSSGNGGPNLNNKWDLRAYGGSNSIFFTGVHRHSEAYLESKDSRGGSNAINIFLCSDAASGNTEFPLQVTGILGTTITSVGSGGIAIRKQYPLAFTGGTGAGGAQGYFIVEDGVLQSITITRPGSYSVAPALSFAAANVGPGEQLVGAAATATLAVTEPWNVSANNSIRFRVDHARLPTGYAAVSLRQDTLYSAGSLWSKIGGSIHVSAAPSGYGLTDGGNVLHHIHLDDITIVGPTTGWSPMAITNPAASGDVRATNIRSSLAYTMPSNVIVDIGATNANAVQVLNP